MKLKKSIESQLQEIVFFFSLLIAFTLFLSGIFYLTLNTQSFTYLTGTFGAAINSSLFAFLGYGFFYFPVISIHMGSIINFHVYNFQDFKRQAPVLSYAMIGHTIILVFFVTLLSIVQMSLEILPTELLRNGSGGWIGSMLARPLHALIGIYGSIILLILGSFVTAIVCGFFELPEVFAILRSASWSTQKATVKSFKAINQSLLNGVQFLLRGNELTEAALQVPQHGKVWITNSWNKANHLITDHFHIYRRDESKQEEKTEAKKSKAKKEVKSSRIELKPVLKRKSAKTNSALEVKSLLAKMIKTEKLENSTAKKTTKAKTNRKK